jgi:hypothetical protein
LRLLLSARWLTAGVAVGILVSISSGVVAALAEDVGSGATVAVVLMPTVLGALVGLTTGSFVRLGVGGAPFAVTAAVAAVFLGPLVPLGAVPILVGAGALRVGERTWVRVTAGLAIALAVALVVGVPLVAAVRDAAGPATLGALGAVAVGIGAGLGALHVVRPR